MATYNFIQSQGAIVPDLATTRSQVEAEWRGVFGADLDLSPETPQGVIVTMLIEARDKTARNNADLANQINPDLSGGVFLDALMSLMGGTRFAATRSVLAGVTLGGVPSTIVPAGSLATTAAGETFRLISTVIIDASGTVKGDFEAVELGPVTVAALGLTRVASSVLGWESVVNKSSATVGRDRESDVRARNRRRLILGLQSVGQNESMISAVMDIPTVQSLSFWENYTGAPITVEGVTLVSHSIYMAIDGGADIEIAKALKRTKNVGAGYNGNTTVTIVDEITGQPYTVKFSRPTAVNLLVRVTVRASAINAQVVVPDAVQLMVKGEIEGDQGLSVGRDVSPFEISAAINFVAPTLFVTKIEISDNGGSTWTSNTKDIKMSEVARIEPSATTVLIV